MKKIYLTLLLLIPAFLVNAQGPIKSWNDKLDDFIEVFNKINPTLENLYGDKGAEVFEFTYFEPESENVVMEASILDTDQYNSINNDVMNQAKDIVVNHLASSTRGNARMNTILGEFEKRGTDIILLYSTVKGGEKIGKTLRITPAEIKAAM